MSFTQQRQDQRHAALFDAAALWARNNQQPTQPAEFWLCFDNSNDRSRGVTQLRQLFPASHYEQTNRRIEGRRYFILKLPEEQAGQLIETAETLDRFIDTRTETLGSRKIGKEGRTAAAEQLEAMLKTPNPSPAR